MSLSDWNADRVTGAAPAFGVPRLHASYTPNLALLMPLTAGTQCRGCSSSGLTTEERRWGLINPSFLNIPHTSGTISMRAAVRADTLTGNNMTGIILGYTDPGVVTMKVDGVYFGTPFSGSGNKLQIDFVLPNGNYSTAPGTPAGPVLVNGYTVGQWGLIRMDKVPLSSTTARYDFYTAPPSDTPIWTLQTTYSPAANWKSPGTGEWPNERCGLFLNDNAAGIGRTSSIDCVSVTIIP